MTRNKRRRSLLGRLVTLLVVLLVACAAVLGVSAYKIHTHIHEAEASYAAYEEFVGANDYAQAASSLGEVAESVSKLNDETHEWYWDVLRGLPVLGEDVDCAQQLTLIADQLADGALLPATQKAEELFADAQQQDLAELVAQKASQVGELLGTLNDAKDVVAECLRQLDEVPTSHFDRLNELSGEVRDALVAANDKLEQYEPLLSVSGLVDLLF